MVFFCILLYLLGTCLYVLSVSYFVARRDNYVNSACFRKNMCQQKSWRLVFEPTCSEHCSNTSFKPITSRIICIKHQLLLTISQYYFTEPRDCCHVEDARFGAKVTEESIFLHLPWIDTYDAFDDRGQQPAKNS